MIAVLVEEPDRYAQELAGVDHFASDDPDVVCDRAASAEILLANPRLAAGVVERLPSLRWVQSTWAGVDALADIGLPEDVTLTRVTDVFGPQMREFVFAYLLTHERNVFQRLASQRGHRWTEPDHGMLAEKALGVMGTGSIGRDIALAARCFGMSVTGLSRSGTPADGFDRVYPVGKRLEFAAGLDHLVVVLPATPETRHLVDGALLERLDPNAVLVNVGRGSVVDTQAVVRALEGGRLRAAVLDVLEQEPLLADSHLWEVPNLFITSHTAAPSPPAEIVAFFRDNLARWLAGEPLRGAVDPERGY